MTPQEKYQQDLMHEDFCEDTAQREAVKHTQLLYEDLLAEYEASEGLITLIRKHFKGQRKKLIRGLYFWGGVGRGKTYLIDAFYDCLPIVEKRRIHFHRFMQMVHNSLKEHKDVEDPLRKVADGIAMDTWVLCLDEFHVTDVTDAMILGRLLKELFDRSITLVTTSNESPDELYREGLQRDRFIPAIALLKKHTHVINVDTGIDYRLRYMDKAEIYHCPLDNDTDEKLLGNFNHIAPDKGEDDVSLEIEGRKIKTRRCADGVVWFEFNDICDGPRGVADYIEIARQFQTVLISNIPVMAECDNDCAKRFMNLVDEFYDRNVKLVVTAAAMPPALYAGNRLAKSFERTISRLQEMLTHDYLAKPHLS